MGESMRLKRGILDKLMYKVFTILTFYKYLSPPQRKGRGLLREKEIKKGNSLEALRHTALAKLKVTDQNQNRETVSNYETLSNPSVPSSESQHQGL